MTIQATNPNRSGAPLALAGDWGTARAPQAAAASAQAELADRATVSDQARQLSAALAGQQEMPKLHLSPSELRELVSPPERR